MNVDQRYTQLYWLTKLDERWLEQELNPKKGLEIKSGGTDCYKLSPISSLFQGPSWSTWTHMTLDIMILLIIMTYFLKDGQYELADYIKKTRNCK